MRTVLAVTLAATLVACSSSTSPRVYAPNPTVEAELMDADRRFAASTQEHGADAWGAAFADDGVSYPAKEEGIRGPAAIRASMADFFGNPAMSLTWEPDEAHAASSGDLGFTVGHASVWRKGADGKKELVRKLKYVTVWKRVAGGGWKIAADIGNED